MGLLHTPLTNTPVTDWTDTAIGPDVPATMMNALGSLERYTNVPVPDAPGRETLMPQAQRYVGQVTYNAATDTFEYWNGTKWETVNRQAALAPSFHVVGGPNVMLQPTQYYDFKFTVNVTSPGAVQMSGAINAWCTTEQTTWGGLVQRYFCDDLMSGDAAINNVYYSVYPGGGQMSLSSHIKMALSVGTHTLGMRVVCQSGNAPVQLGFVALTGIKVSNAPTSAPGPECPGTGEPDGRGRRRRQSAGRLRDVQPGPSRP